MNKKELRYARADENVRRKIRDFLRGSRKNSKLCIKADMVTDYERSFQVILIQREPVDAKRGLYMYEIVV